MSCPFGAVPVGGSVIASFQVDVAADAPASITNTATILANERDLVLANNTATRVTPIADGIAPRVASLDAVPPVPGGNIETCAEVGQPISALVITFDEEVFDPPGHADPDDVTNPANYLLLAPGDDRGFSTRECGPLQGDDVSLPIAVSYSAAAATLTVLDTLPLADGLYRLLACGSTSIRDLGGNALDGRGNGTAGDDFLRTFRIDGVNQLAGGHFDCDLEPWEAEPPSSPAYSSKDSDNSGSSGSARIENPPAGSDVALAQCVEIQPVPEIYNYQVAARVLLDAAPGVTIEVSRLCELYGAPLCAEPLLATEGGTATLSETAGGWLLFEDVVAMPASATSALCVFRVQAVGDPDFTAFLDDLRFGAETPRFVDGFESGDLRFWSVVKR